MKILISYRNSVHDYRGSLPLQCALEALGHQVWLRPHWDEEVIDLGHANRDVAEALLD